MAAAAHRTPVRKGPTHHLLVLSVGSLHSCHPQLGCLEAQDSPLDSDSFPHAVPPMPQDLLLAHYLETFALSLLLQDQA